VKKASSRKKLAAGKTKARAKTKKVVAKQKKATVAAPKKKATAKTRTKTPVAKKKTRAPVAKKKTRAPVAKKKTPVDRASDRAMAVAAQLPEERALNEEEREAMGKVALTATAALGTDGAPGHVVAAIAAFVDDVRGGRRAEPNGQDVRLGLGVLWGEQVRVQVGWRWVHLSYANGFASYALVPDDRAFACFPLNRVTELMVAGADGVDTSLALFDSIRLGTLPGRRAQTYLVIG